MGEPEPAQPPEQRPPQHKGTATATLQFGSEDHAHRVARYWAQQQDVAVFPPGLASSCEQQGVLVVLHGVGGARALSAWLRQARFIERVLGRLYVTHHAAPSRGDALRAIVAAGTRGISCARLAVWPRSQEVDVGDELLAAGYSAPMHPREFSHVLSVVLAPDGACRWGYVAADEAWCNPCDVPSRFKSSAASAINKLAEAMQVLGLQAAITGRSDVLEQLACFPGTSQQQQQQQQQQQEQQQQQQQQQQQAQHERAEQPQGAQRIALDLGACPGGWTSWLADFGRCSLVIAVDPAPLSAAVTARPNVVQLQARAQDAVEAVQALLRARGRQGVDLLVCDMNDHPRRARALIAPLLAQLAPGGWLIMTLKFFGKGRKRDDVLPQMDAALEGAFEPGRLLWLLANTACERTFAARKL